MNKRINKSRNVINKYYNLSKNTFILYNNYNQQLVIFLSLLMQVLELNKKKLY